MKTWCLEWLIPDVKYGLPFKACPIVSYMMRLKPLLAPHLFVHPSLKNKSSYDKAPCIVSSYHQSFLANLKPGYFLALSPNQLPTSPSTHQQTPFILYLLQ